jgi:N6-L-threonylcarbamoyladenine synthase
MCSKTCIKLIPSIYSLEALAASYGLPLICPPPKLCTDNGVMIAWAGIERYQAGLIDDYEITTIPKWPIEKLKDAIVN